MILCYVIGVQLVFRIGYWCRIYASTDSWSNIQLLPFSAYFTIFGVWLL